ncbi:M15 family metallopeptidase [Paenibacillus mucilaginosus]|uniref:Peptidase M15B and M15C DD-carboxypeptidase VanY/endolysin n=1 Tax=Paenibacillus mucilaginosus (strain KNP414) TaxID=1036673 RepID=F8FIM8_PAEMK|nr:M15 family metallopeptidase [Paenibacillus mucilaginosus]AEI45482.1 peptidase M15B and M15C DD-carboxypeptidase VanY/endolysin [Paenibacillus mucilaginosus KNP414]MCG7215239.1 D-alanyl-D-alanine carboxypeptidase family protein [Paenibacillus mucilaginosus]WDM26907.1 D-alanyl-D-alanine carboxypeptidase family protein [Paenibacillus mucilaginosus]
MPILHHRTRRHWSAALLLCTMLAASGCVNPAGQSTAPPPVPGSTEPAQKSPSEGTAKPPSQPAADPAGKTPGTGSAAKPDTGAKDQPAPAEKPPAVQVAAEPASIAVLVNKTNKLPENYRPADLVDPKIPFIFEEKLEKRKIRKEAAGPLEKLFAAAEKAGLPLSGVSAYRSHETQKTLYTNYVLKDGEEAANKYSAKPGHSEHETGLAIDVTSRSGKCAASDCFGATKEAAWLASHSHEFGFIIRYPKGKESITGYQYEPWHLRYVGQEAASAITKGGLTLEEYLSGAAPVSKP